MKRLAELRKARNLTQKQLAAEMNLEQSSISAWEQGKNQPDIEKLITLGRFFHVSVDFLIGASDHPGMLDESPCRIPVYDRITDDDAGSLSPAGFEWIPAHMIGPGRSYIGLKISDDSMAPRFLPGDTVIALRSHKITSGRYGLITVEDGDARMRRLLKTQAGVLLQAVNLEAEQEFYTNAEVKNLPVCVIGTIVRTIRNEK